MSFVLLKTLTSILLSWGICFYNGTLPFQHYQFLFINWLILTGIQTYLNITHLKNKNKNLPWPSFFFFFFLATIWFFCNSSQTGVLQIVTHINYVSFFYHLLFFFNQCQPVFLFHHFADLIVVTNDLYWHHLEITHEMFVVVVVSCFVLL